MKKPGGANLVAKLLRHCPCPLHFWLVKNGKGQQPDYPVERYCSFSRNKENEMERLEIIVKMGK